MNALVTPRRLLLALAFPAALLSAWQLAADSNLLSPVYFPAPSRVLAALYRSGETGALWGPLVATTLRMFQGWFVACLLGVSVGALIGSSSRARDYLNPTLEFLRPFPTSAVIPAAILIFGFSQWMTIWVIAFGSLWPVILNTLHGFAAIEPKLKEVSQTLEMRPIDYVRKVAFPSALPDIFTGIRISLFIALILAVVVEMQAGQPGLGQNILLAQRMFKSPELYAGIIVLGIFGYFVSAVLNVAERKLLVWKAN